MCVLSISAFAALPAVDRTLSFALSDSGVPKPISWGLDVAWISRENVLRGMAFMGAENVDIIRSSFTPSAALSDGDLPAAEMAVLNQRMNLVALLPEHTQVALNCDQERGISSYFYGHPDRWAELIDITRKHHEKSGRKVITVSPFNEPDYSSWGQGSLADFKNIALALKAKPSFDSIRISGGNTLNTDKAKEYYTNLKSVLDEGNTHQLAGSFDNYAAFFTLVRKDGRHATNDELHNVMEAMVGVEYGMQTGIWWGTAEYARGEFAKASKGRRIAYAEHRPNWTAASVYRSPEGKVQAFAGASERQAVSTTYRFLSTETDVFYDGEGPQREYLLEIPGGTGYQANQPNAERVVNITWGDDIQPVINGTYMLVNRRSGKVMEVQNGSKASGSLITQSSNKKKEYQQWHVKPVSSRVGGDFSYFSITAVHNNKSLDVLDWSVNDGAGIILYDHSPSNSNQQWYLDYAGDGWFYIRSRHSSLCLQVAQFSTADGAVIQQGKKTGANSQQWRFLPVETYIEFAAPAAPQHLMAVSNPASVRLHWTASSARDVKSYSVFRAEQAGGPYQTIARYVTDTFFVDNKTEQGSIYYYVVKTEDLAQNRSVFSEEVSASCSGKQTMVLRYPFEGNTQDTICNHYHAKAFHTTYTDGLWTKALSMNGSDAYLQLPVYAVRHKELSLSAWVYWNGTNAGGHLFDFGNGLSENLYLTPEMRFIVQRKNIKTIMQAPVLPAKQWTHVVLCLSPEESSLYINGTELARSSKAVVDLSQMNVLLNYIGRGQSNTDPLFSGSIDEFCLYNKVLTAEEIALLAGSSPTSQPSVASEEDFSYCLLSREQILRISCPDCQNKVQLFLYDSQGRLLLRREYSDSFSTDIDMSKHSGGLYILRWQNAGKTGEAKLMFVK